MVNRTINAKTLRSELGDVMRRVERGERFTILYRSRPVCQVIPLDAASAPAGAVEEDPLYRAPAVGASTDGLTSADHDVVLYGRGR